MDYLRKLIASGENQQLDFKFEVSDSRKIARTLVAFANTGGGRLLIGVKDNGAIAGVRSEEEFFMMEGAAAMYCKPQIPFEVKRWVVDGKTVLEVIIKAGKNRPFYAKEADGKWIPYIRVKDENLEANNIILKVWERQRKPEGTTVEFTRTEELLLRILQVQEKITLRGLCEAAKISEEDAETVLVKLICMEIIEIEHTAKGEFFRPGKTGPG